MTHWFGVYYKMNHIITKKKNNNYNFSKIKPLHNHWIFKHLNIDKKKNYFELGPGAFNLYKTFHNKGWKCYGIEPNSFIKAPGIKKKFNEINVKADISVATDVLEHVNNPVVYLKNIFCNKFIIWRDGRVG